MKRFLDHCKQIFISGDMLALFGYAGIFILLLSPIRNGIGIFWDWSIPYYKDQFSNLFYFKYLSWNDTGFGSPLGYSSDYYLRFILGHFPFQPETNMFLLILISFCVTAFFAYKTFLKKHSITAFIIGLVTIINPLVFYKVMAGHYLHIVSYAIFSYLVYFMFHSFSNTWKHYVILALLLSFIGFQIQFFIFSAIFLFVYFIGNRKQFSLKKIILVGIIAGCINSVWLINFITGANNLVEISNFAKTVSFSDSQSAEYSNILFLSFSAATQIKTLYPQALLVTFLGTYLIPLFYLFTEKVSHQEKIILANVLIFLFLSTGLYNYFQIPGIKLFYPMIREVGHFGVLIIYFFMLLIKLPMDKKTRTIKIIISSYFIYFVLVNFFFFQTSLPTLNFAKVRDIFLPYKEFLDKESSGMRILTYPFFNQYGLLSEETKVKNEKLMSNAGQDNFIIFSGKPFVSQAVPPTVFQQSLQYRFVKSGYDTDILLPYNIKYLFDFSHIYESNFQKYVPSSVYEDNIKYIKNDPNFMQHVIEKNPGKVALVEPHILKLTNAHEKITATSPLRFKKVDPTSYLLNFSSLKKGDEIIFRESYQPKWSLDGVAAKHEKTLGYAQKWTILENTGKVTLSLYFQPQTPFLYSRYLSLGMILASLAYLGYKSLYIDK